MKPNFTEEEIDRIIQMAWEDRTTFDAIEKQFGINESAVIKLMRQEMKESSFKHWRKHVQNRKTKHEKLRSEAVNRFKCSRQRMVSSNKIAKR